uniref:Variant surface glycoprotein 1125.4196 n=1 Tax=Trypanosoma brucei TaxID=5691 RepID=A0A1J0RA52_9TRYP|nr:variant surface glycoprotein 1125.4196 [Trypanosoma brucei]
MCFLAHFIIQLVVSTAVIEAAETAKGDNAADFAMICRFINMAQTLKPVPQYKDEVDALATEVVAINMTVAGPALSDLIEKDKIPETLTEKTKAPQSGPEKEKWTAHWKLWQAAKAEITDPVKAKKYALWKAAKLAPHARALLLQAAERAHSVYSQAPALRAEVSDTGIKADASKALYGGDGTAKAAPSYGSGGRGAICGTPPGYTNSQAGSSLQLDVICLCAFQTNGLDGGEACCKDCATGPGTLDTTDWNPNGDSTNIWTALKNGCTNIKTGEQLTLEAVQAAKTDLLQKLHSARAGASKEYSTYLGQMDGTAAGGCSGRNSDGGRCVAYNPKVIKPGGGGIPWLNELTKAATSTQTMEAAATKLTKLSEELEKLNASTHLLVLNVAYGGEGNTQASKEQSTKSSGAKTTKCKPQNATPAECPDTDCDYDKENGCTAKPVTETAEAGEGAAGTNAQGKKCSEKKKEEECKDGCNWDGKECKDSIFLAHKILVMVVAFMR